MGGYCDQCPRCSVSGRPLRLCTGCWPLLAGAGSEADMSVTALPRHTTLYTLPALPAYPGADHNHNTI